jgi:type I restriction enzyme S subunit
MAAYPTAPLRDVCAHVEYGYTASSTPDSSVGPRFLRITDIVPERLDWESVPFCAIEPKKLAKHRLHTGDIVIARTGATTGWAKYIKDPPEAVFASYLVRVRPASSVDARYIGFVVESSVYKDFIQQHMGGAAQPNANAQVLTSFEVPLPPLPIQRRIAGILSAYDDLIENCQRRTQILEEMARSLYREWFVNFRYPGNESVPLVPSALGDIPVGWDVRTLGDFVQIQSGFAFKSGEFVDGGEHRLVTIKNVQDGLFNPNTDSRLNVIPANLPAHCLLSEGDILLSLTGNVGRVCFVFGGSFLLNQRVAKLKPADPQDWAMAYSAFRQPEMLKKMVMLSNGVAQQNLSPIAASKTEFVLPSKHVRNQFSHLVTPMLQKVLILSNTIQNLRQTRDLLLPRLMSGQLEVTVD